MSASASATADATGRTGRRLSTVAALVVLTAVLAVVAGPTGVVAGAATAVTWYGLGTPYALAAGHVVLATAFRGGVDPLPFAVAELAFVAFLLAAAGGLTRPGDAAVALAGAAGLVGAAWISARSQPLWVAAGTVLLALALAAYALHRYELVRLGLVPDDLEAETDASQTHTTHEQ